MLRYSSLRMATESASAEYTTAPIPISTPVSVACRLTVDSVSYTHLDVYKRQCLVSCWAALALLRSISPNSTR